MSLIPLSNTIENVERSIYHSIRHEVVDKGYLPDILNYTTVPDYRAAITTVKNNMGFAIEIFNNSNPQAKGLLQIPRIVIITQDALPGQIGAGPERQYTLDTNAGKYIESVLPPQTFDFTFAIHLLSNTVVQQRILKSLLALAMPKRGYIDDYVDAVQKYFVREIQYRSLHNTIEGILEDIYIYQAPDLYENNEQGTTQVGIIQRIDVDVINDNNEQKLNTITVPKQP